MHINTLYFSYMKPLIKIHSVMYHGKCTVILSFLENGRGGLCMYLYMVDTSFLFEKDTIYGPNAKYSMQFIFQQLFCFYDIE